jgi:BCD family chlorophyll transporter-like MFS transporter
MGDIVLAGVWNRIMISDFGIPAWPVGLLIAMRNLLAPISLWVGNRSDNRPLWGSYRTSYIWLGRGIMLLAFPLLGFSTVRLETNSADPVGWLAAATCFMLYGLGSLLSGSPYLALVRDSAPESKQGIAIGIVETVLIALFPIVAIVFSRMLVTYDPVMFWRFLLFVIVAAGFFWFFAVVGIEKRNRTIGPKTETKPTRLRATFQKIWADSRTRDFFVLLFVATFSAWMQDNILEPFGADIFGMDVAQTTRLTAYWGTATLLVIISSMIIWRKRPPEYQSDVTAIGLVVMAAGMFGTFTSALTGQESLFLLLLVVFGAGFGLYTFGGLSLMAVMSPNPHAGAYLGLWTVAILISKGLGTFAGGVLRDILLFMNRSPELAYGLTFAIAGVGLLLAAWLATQLDVLGFARDTGRCDQRKVAVAETD